MDVETEYVGAYGIWESTLTYRDVNEVKNGVS